MNLAALAGARRHTSAAFACSSSADNIWSSAGRHHLSAVAVEHLSAPDEAALNKSPLANQQQHQEPPEEGLKAKRPRAKDKRRHKREEAERVEKLRLLVSYLRNGSAQDMCLQPVQLEADEIELAERYKLHLNLCDECGHTSTTGEPTATSNQAHLFEATHHHHHAAPSSSSPFGPSGGQPGSNHLRARSANSLASSMRSTGLDDSGSLITRASGALMEADSCANQLQAINDGGGGTAGCCGNSVAGIVINFRRPNNQPQEEEEEEEKQQVVGAKQQCSSPRFLTPNSFGHFSQLLVNKLSVSASSPSIASAGAPTSQPLCLANPSAPGDSSAPLMLTSQLSIVGGGGSSPGHPLSARHHHHQFGGSSGCSRTSTASTSTTSATSCALNQQPSHAQNLNLHSHINHHHHLLHHNNSVGATPARSWSSDLFLSSTPAAGHHQLTRAAPLHRPDSSQHLPLDLLHHLHNHQHHHHQDQPSLSSGAGSVPASLQQHQGCCHDSPQLQPQQPPPPPPKSASTKSVGAWTNPQNLATWIDNEVNSLVNDLELTTSQLSSKEEKPSKSGASIVGCAKLKWFSSGSNSRRNSSGAHST